MSIHSVLSFVFSVEGAFVLAFLFVVVPYATMALIVAWDDEYHGDYGTREALMHWDAYSDSAEERTPRESGPTSDD